MDADTHRCTVPVAPMANGTASERGRIGRPHATERGGRPTAALRTCGPRWPPAREREPTAAWHLCPAARRRQDRSAAIASHGGIMAQDAKGDAALLTWSRAATV